MVRNMVRPDGEQVPIKDTCAVTADGTPSASTQERTRQRQHADGVDRRDDMRIERGRQRICPQTRGQKI